jgi:hypothetical protein
MGPKGLSYADLEWFGLCRRRLSKSAEEEPADFPWRALSRGFRVACWLLIPL